MGKPDPVFETCACPEAPVMWWLVPHDGWQVAYSLTADRDVKADSAEYIAVGALAFQVSCPTCGRVYLRGVQ